MNAQSTNGKGVALAATMEERVAYTLDWWENNKDEWLLPPAETETEGEEKDE